MSTFLKNKQKIRYKNIWNTTFLSDVTKRIKLKKLYSNKNMHSVLKSVLNFTKNENSIWNL